MRWLIIGLIIFCHYGFAVCPPAFPEPVRLKLKDNQQIIEAKIQISQGADGEQQLLLQDLQRGFWHKLLTFSIEEVLQQVQAKPLIEDANLDGIADHIWLLSLDGKLWRWSLQSRTLTQPRLMADLSDSGLNFIASAGLLRARLPGTLAPLAWRQADQQLVLIVARNTQSGQDTLIMLRFPMQPQPINIINFHQLADRTVISESENSTQLSVADWRALLAKAGWKVQLPGKLSTAPKVVAGVIYAAVANTNQPNECIVDTAEQQLLAIHLHTASQVYSNRYFNIPYLAEAKLDLQRHADSSLRLVLRAKEHTATVLPDLRKISADCHNCSEPLSLDRFPLWQRLATYRSEQGAY